GETAVIFTTNVGARNLPHERPVLEDLMESRAGDPESCKREVRQHFRRCVEKFFSEEIGRPELFNRLRAGIVPFNPILDDSVRIAIAARSLSTMESQFAHRYRERGLRLEIDRSLAGMILAGWVSCPNDDCARTVLLGDDRGDPEIEPRCPACRTVVGPAPTSGPQNDGEERGTAAFGGRGIADDVEALLAFPLSIAILGQEKQDAVTPGRFVARLGARGNGGTALVDITFEPGA
ncbi:MAG TPA: hypothetical protein VHX40_09620, partial [Acidimicrobiales bacterium]|nr:hypothetical protein [Acidimicrobiales bacterium]